MASVLRMPGVSADSEEAALVEWSVGIGATLGDGDTVAIVETEKANVDIVSDTAGHLWRTLAAPGDSVVVGNPIAVILGDGESEDAGLALLRSLGLDGEPDSGDDSPPEDGEQTRTSAPEVAEDLALAAPPETEPAQARAPEAGESAAVVSAPKPDPDRAERSDRVFASPLVRRLADEAGVPLDSIRGSGPHGRIVKRDLEKVLAAAPVAAEAAPKPPAPSSPPADLPAPQAGDIPHTRMRRAIATALTGSKQQSPHFYLSTTVRMDEVLALRTTINTTSSTRVSVNDFVIKGIAEAFVAVPEANVMWMPEAVRPLQAVDVSVAIGSAKGLVTPVIRNADQLRITEVSRRVRDFVARADEGRLKQEELQGGSFTVSNLGMYGVEEFSAIINPPQVGILAVGAVVATPVVEGDRIVPANVMTVTASFDHRPVDGVLGAQWLAAFKKAMENPLSLLA